MDNVLRRLIEEKIINHAKMMMSKIEKFMGDFVDGSEAKEHLDKYHKSYHAVAKMQLNEYNGFEEFSLALSRNVQDIYHNHQVLLGFFGDKRTKLRKLLEDTNGQYYTHIIDDLKKKSEEINGIIEHGKSVSDFKKLDGFRDKIDRVAIVSNKNKCYRNGKFNEEAFIKGCATYMWLKNEDFFTKLLSYYFLEEKKLEQTKERVLNAFYNHYKDNPDLLKVE
mgnify:FL=1